MGSRSYLTQRLTFALFCHATDPHGAIIMYGYTTLNSSCSDLGRMAELVRALTGFLCRRSGVPTPTELNQLLTKLFVVTTESTG